MGIHEDTRFCLDGLACVDHACVESSCAKQGCEAAAPVCNPASDACEACTTNDDCVRFSDTTLCNADNGGCVECLSSADCGGTTPTCDNNSCRACRVDSDCSTGACGDDGACVEESDIVYLDPGGADSGTCTRSSPCRTIMYGVSKMGGARNHLVMAFGTYVELVEIAPSSTAATSIVVHGGYSGLYPPMSADVETLSLGVDTVVKELKVFGRRPVITNAVSAEAAEVRFERSAIDSGGRGIEAFGKLTLIDTTLVGDGDHAIRLFSTARLIIDRVVIRGTWMFGISSESFTSTVEISNLLLFGTKNLAIDLPQTAGTIAFSTIADSGTDSGTGPRAVNCSPGLTIRSSIIWAPGIGTASREPVAGCNLATTIAGPTPVVGGDGSNPAFADPSTGDYHLSATSPARDRVDTGPGFDFEGDPRPRGAKFDIGADEAP